MISRREFLTVSLATGGGLLLGFSTASQAETAPASVVPAVASGKDFAPNAWVRIAPDGQITLVVSASEMGQGAMTALPMLIAEELDAEWGRFNTEFAPANQAYANPLLGGQITGGSATVRGFYTKMREVGATAREMLLQAAAKQWSVSANALITEPGRVVHPGSGRIALYGELAEAAASVPVPGSVMLKSEKDFRIIGKPTPRLDTPIKVNGQAGFGIDARPEDLRIATIERCPVFGGKVKSFDATAAKAVKGVLAVIGLDHGVAVLARDYWTAEQGRQQLKIDWDLGPLADLSSEGITRMLRAGVETKARPAAKHGQGAGALPSAGSKKIFRAVYQVPYLAHTCMEPMNCTAAVTADGVTVWAPTQAQGNAQRAAAKAAGVDASKVMVHTTFLGGGFGRRSESDFVTEAVQLAKQHGHPVKVIWSRPDDVQHDYYRPIAYNELSAELDAHGMPKTWVHRIAGPSIWSRIAPARVKNGIDPSAVEGAADLPYAIPNLEVTYALIDPGVPVGFWRSVGHSQNAYVVECFLDELAAQSGQDPFEYRKKLLKDQPRYLAVLEKAAEMANWGKPLPKRHHHGIAVAKAFGSYCAQVAEVSIESGKPRVHKVHCAIDCGVAVNPSGVEAQMQSAIVYGLTAALSGKITLKNGRVQQQNFNDYPALRIDEMPEIAVAIIGSGVESGHTLGGVGEPGLPPIAPAVVNALRAATGKPQRELPIRL
ncbi:xanthine dehydrogenase family protein molybdopterin-binding subunit [Halothiobacillus sp.]|uniref:xanthine dehydrogenase family protein molybdopterin-binding subunit n=1 Tax=Halothiobacillus sp. TaxID=1891311 RepID=UPI002AD5077E|nr:xanthine dehydrogenase family protein molybdopterin-binding subunit [Halothiobacillus sp.]